MVNTRVNHLSGLFNSISFSSESALLKMRQQNINKIKLYEYTGILERVYSNSNI